MNSMLSLLVLLCVTVVPVSGGLRWNLKGRVHALGLEKYLKGSARRENLYSSVKDMMEGMCAYSETVKTISKIKKDRNQMQSGMLRTCGGKIKDCTDLKSKSCVGGVYELNPDTKTSFNAYCDMKTDGGGWTVIQRRQNGILEFNRYWKDYKQGFGDIGNEHWLGNDNIYKLTSKGRYELRIELVDWNGETRYALYKSFTLGSESTNYKIDFGSYSGNAGNSLSHNKGKPFSTMDRDNSYSKCSKKAVGAWWYYNCTHSNLNGEYLRGKFSGGDSHRGMVWAHWKGFRHSLHESTMMIRRY